MVLLPKRRPKFCPQYCWWENDWETTQKQNLLLDPIHIGDKPQRQYDRLLATWEDFNQAPFDQNGYVSLTIARDPAWDRRGPQIAYTNATGQLSFI